MMRTIHAPRLGLVAFEPPSRRQRMARRRLAVISGLCGLALASGVVQALIGSDDVPRTTSIYVASR